MSSESPAGTYKRITKLTDKLIEAEDALKEHPGYQHALEVQRVKQLRKNAQSLIKPYLIRDNQ